MKLREPKCDSDHDRLAQRMVKLDKKLFSVMERNAELEKENARLRGEVADLKQQLAAARKELVHLVQTAVERRGTSPPS